MRSYSPMFTACIFILLSLSQTSCKNGPKISPCVSNPAQSRLECVTYDEKIFQVDYGKAENYVCFSPESARIVYETCTRAPAIIEVCVLSVAEFSLACADTKNNSRIIPLDLTDNFVCFSPGDAQTLFQYCAGPARKGY